MKKRRVGLLFGGKSVEHEVSLQGARNVFEALDKEKYEPVLIGIDKLGKWHLHGDTAFLMNNPNPPLTQAISATQSMALIPGQLDHQLMTLPDHQTTRLDVIFPIIHGPLAEDGTVQGLLQLANLPFVGSGVLGSAIGMDKEITKRLLKEAGLPVGKFLCFHRSQVDLIDLAEIKAQLGWPVFVKPANAGSSVGVHKIKKDEDFSPALADAFQFDHKVMIEEAITGREIEVAVLGNDAPKASVPGEVIPTHEFYSYEAKYIDEKGAALNIPAQISDDLSKKFQDLALQTFKTLQGAGMARVDFFLTPDHQIYLNEINTIPGFTKISMYPQLWKASGLTYPELIDRLIELALERFERDQKLKTSIV